MEVTPVVMEMRPVIGVAIAVAHAAAAEHGRGAKAATMDRNATASEPATMKRGTAASESTAVKPAAAEATASTTMETAAAMTAVPDFGRQIVGCKFR